MPILSADVQQPLPPPRLPVAGASATDAEAVLCVERLTTEAALAAVVPEWEALAAGISPRLPFASPLWKILWWQHFQRKQPAVRDHLHVYALRDAGNRLIALAPMMISHRPARGPLRVREMQFFGADANMTELREVICRASDLRRVTAALETAMQEDQAHWDCVQWRGLRLTPDLQDWREHIAGFQPTRVLPLFLLNLPANWDALRSQLPRNVKEAIRKCYNAPARDGHQLVFSAVHRPEDIPGAVERFLTLHRCRASAEVTVRHADVFASPFARAFLRQYAAARAECGMIRVFELSVAGTVVASRIGFVLQDELYLYYSGYEPRWGRYSVMTRVLAEALQWAITHGIAVANLSTGDDVSKTRWRPDVIGYQEGVTVAPALRSRIAFATMAWLRRRRQAQGG